MHLHVLATHSIADSPIYSAPRESLGFHNLAATLAEPLTKQRRIDASDDAPLQPDIDCPDTSCSGRVCFKMTFTRLDNKKTLPVAIGAGGSLRRGVAVTIHNEIDHQGWDSMNTAWQACVNWEPIPMLLIPLCQHFRSGEGVVFGGRFSQCFRS
jgi:hypothetical protein